MFPRAREENHKEKPVHPLLEAGTFGGDDDTRPAAFVVDGRDEPLRTDGGDVQVQNAVEDPAGLTIDQVDRPHH